MRKLYIICFAVFAAMLPLGVMAQCTLTLTATPPAVCVGDSVVITASATFPTGGFSFDFNNSQLPPGWTYTGSQTWSAPCAAPSLDNSPFYWSGSIGAVTPSVTTAALNVSNGGDLIFDFRFYPNSGAAPCETADQYNEGVSIEYSTDGGLTWSLVTYFCSVPAGGPWSYTGGYAQTLSTIPVSTVPGNGNGSCGIFDTWASYTIPIPPAAQTSATQFRWYQYSSSSNCCDNWGIDNINVNAFNGYYDWSTGLQGFGANTQTIHNLQNDSTIIVTLVDTASGSLCSDTIVIQVYDLPVPVLTYDNPICAGEQVTFDGTASTPIGGISNYQFDLNNDGIYEYSFTNGVQNFSYFVIAGNYTIGYQVTTPGGCSAETDFPVQVYAIPTVNVSANPLEVCKGSPINLLGQGSIINPPSLPSTITQFVWDYENDGSTDMTDPGTGTSTNKQSAQTALYVIPGTFWAHVNVETSGGCSSSDSIQVVVHDLPVAGFTSTVVCFEAVTDLQDTSLIIPPDFINTYAWTITDGSGYTYTSGTNDVQVTLPDTGTYTATLIIISGEGCTDTAQNTITVFPQPTADFTYMTGCFGHNTFMDQTTGGASPYFLSWDLNDDGVIDTTALAVFEYVYSDTNTQDVTLTIVDDNGCTSTITKPVDVKGGVQDPLMPNMMKLSSSIGNDKLDFEQFAPGFNDCMDYTIVIFNRWGIKVYEAENKIANPDLNCSNCFAGKTLTGSSLEPGTYYYVLKGVGNYGQYPVEKKGTLTIFN